MPSFLSKVFGRKKDEKEHSNGRDSESSLLEGKFEAVSPTVSPTAAKFAEANGHGKDKEKEKEREFGFKPFKTKSNTASPTSAQTTRDFPHLSLSLASDSKDQTNSRVIGAVFDADPDSQILLPENSIGERRLSPQETTELVRVCAQAITARGLETLGIMHPHWYSASPDVQRRLISFYIHSLAPNSPLTTLFPSSTPQAAFESEVQFTRSPHDVAAVLRWGIRHLKLQGAAFGNTDTWYKDFLNAERSADYPPDAFSSKLVPLLPPAHVDTLKTILEIMSTLAAHTEANSTSGSKLAKLFGLWLLSIPRVEPQDDWASFYARWECSGRMLEHLFLSHIREQDRTLRMPTRLTELIQRYPFSKNPTDSDIFPRPRFTTRTFDSLYVRVETQSLKPNEAKISFHPLLLVLEAFRAEGIVPANGDLWEKIKKAAQEEGAESPQFNQIFSDETLRLFSMLPVDKDYVPLLDSVLPSRKRSISLGAIRTPIQAASPTVHARAHTDEPKQVTSPTSPSAVTPDWAEFSTAGFLESSDVPLTLSFLDKDVEVTAPKKAAKKSKGSPNPGRGRKSLENRPPPPIVPEFKPVSTCTSASVTQIDEAFVDFWSDALLDPISAEWPSFVLCKLKSSSDFVVDEKKIEWLVLEQAFVKPPKAPSPVRAETSESSSSRPRASSPRPSFRSDLSGPFSATRKRFSIFTGGRNSRQSMDSVTSPTKSKSSRGKKAAAKSPRVGEMGEILAEEPEEPEREKAKAKVEAKKVAEAPVIRVPSPKPKKSLDVSKKSLDGGQGQRNVIGASLAAGAVAVAAGTAIAVASETAPEQDVVPETVAAEPVSASPPVPVQDQSVPEAEPATDAVVPETVEPAAVAPVTLQATEPEAPTNVPVAEDLSTPEKLEEAPVVSSGPVADTAATPEPQTEPQTEDVPVPEPVQEAVIEPVPAPEPAVSEPVKDEEPVVPEPVEVEESVVTEPVKEEEPVVSEPEPAVLECTPEVVPEPVKVEAPAVPEPEVPSPVVEAPQPYPEEVSTVEAEATKEEVKEEPVVPVEPAPELSEPVAPVTEDIPVTVDEPVQAETSEPPVDVIAEPTSAPSAPVELEAVPVVDAAPIVDETEASVEPISTEPKELSSQPEASEVVDAGLPPAPESVVLTGETPGPQVALSSSEPVAIAQSVVSSTSDAEAESKEDVVVETQDKSSETHSIANGNGTAPPPEPSEPVANSSAQESVESVSKEEKGDVATPLADADETASPSDTKVEEASPAETANGNTQS
ncbi:hypothetical protein ONZ45_g5674 [Pleurotus djamor]|nr:hypothetical protein ONZ45_g5674 [Pleurotus djamor]